MKRKARSFFLFFISIIFVCHFSIEYFIIKVNFTSISQATIGKISTTPEVINDFKTKDLLDFPPYLERYRGTRILLAIETDSTNNRIFFPLDQNGVGIYYLNNHSVQEYFTPFSNYTITQIAYESATDNLFVGSTNGLFVLNINRGNTTYFNESTSFDENYVQSMVLDETHEKLYINTREGLKILYTNNFTFMNNQNLPSQLRTGGTGKIMLNSIMNLLYFTAANKLLSYNISSNILEEIFYSEDFDYDFIRALYYNRDNNTLLLGCHGVIILNCSTNEVITNYNISMGLLSKVVTKITYTPSYGGVILTDQNDKGLAVINTTSKEIQLIRREDGLLTNLFGSLDIYSENSTTDYLIIGGRGAITLFDIENISVTDIKVFNFDLPYVYTSYLTINSENNLAFVSVEEYLSVFNITSRQFSNYDYIYGFPEAHITETVYDSESNKVFVGTTLGVYVFNLTAEEVVKSYTTHEGLVDNNTRSLYYLKETNELYIGTNNGLNVIDLQTDEIRNYSKLDMHIYSMIYDNVSKNLYLGSANHLQILNIQTSIINTFELGETSGDKFIHALEIHTNENILFAGTDNGLFLIDLEELIIEKHFTFENSKLTDNLIDGLYFNQDSEKLFIANLGVVMYDYKHDFWLNLNDAYLIDEELFLVYIEDLAFNNDVLYLVAPYNGLYILNMTDSDKDGIESCFEDWLFKTDPLKYDTDEDGDGDGEELWAGTDPLDPNSFPRDYPEWWIIFFIVLLSALFLMFLLIAGLYFKKDISKF